MMHSKWLRLTLVKAVVFMIISISSIAMAEEQTAVLIWDKEPGFVILIHDSPPTDTYEVVAELNTWLRKIAGVNLPVRRESAWDGNTPYISVGWTKIAQENGWADGPFKQEEARVFIEKDRIGIIGNDDPVYPGSNRKWQGSYYAVVEFVQKALGVYWIWPGELGEVYEKRDTIEVALGSWTWIPDLPLMREMPYSSRTPTDLVSEYFRYANHNPQAYVARNDLVRDSQTWAKRKRMGRVPHLSFAHSYSNWWELYGKTHPDWFAKPPAGTTQTGGRGVKLNLSNPEVQDKVFDNWKAAWESNPQANKFYPIGPNDSRGFDTRPQTRAWDAPEMARYSEKEIWNSSEPILSDRYVKFWNIIARRVKEVDPEVRLTTLAYRNYQKPPLGNERIEDNIIIAYVGGEGYYPDDRHLRDEWVGWSERGAQLVWRPNLLHSGHGIPYLYSRMLYEDFQFLRQHGMVGAYFDSLTGHWSMQGLTYYVLSEVFSRPEASYEELAGEYFNAFGPAAEPIRQFHEFFEERTHEMPAIMRSQNLVPNETWGGWWGAHVRIIPYFLTPDAVSHADELLRRADQAVSDADPVYQNRVSTVKAGFDHAKLMATTFRRLRLDHSNLRMPYEKARDILKPLWDLRLQMSENRYLALTVLRTLAYEEHQLGIWKAFRYSYVPDVAVNAFDIPELKNDWLFRADPQNRGIEQRWFEETSFRSRDWSGIKVGTPWRQALSHAGTTNIGWYRVAFNAPEQADTGGRVSLHFESVDAEVRLWVNGRLVLERGYPHNGNYDSWSEPFQVDITDQLNFGARNVIVVRVESESNNAGITGAVSLQGE